MKSCLNQDIFWGKFSLVWEAYKERFWGVWRGDSFIIYLCLVERRGSSAFDLDLPHIMGRNTFSSSPSIA